MSNIKDALIETLKAIKTKWESVHRGETLPWPGGLEQPEQKQAIFCGEGGAGPDLPTENGQILSRVWNYGDAPLALGQSQASKGATMKDFTVVGLYHDNKQVWVGHVQAETVEEAVVKAKSEVSGDCDTCGGGGGDPVKDICETCNGTGKESKIAVLSVFEGEHKDVYGEDELIED